MTGPVRSMIAANVAIPAVMGRSRLRRRKIVQSVSMNAWISGQAFLRGLTSPVTGARGTVASTRPHVARVRVGWAVSRAAAQRCRLRTVSISITIYTPASKKYPESSTAPNPREANSVS